MAFAFVALLYIWPQDLPRDNPIAIKRRFASVAIACVASPFVILLIGSPSSDAPSIATWLGFPPVPLLSYLLAVLLPLLLVAILFAGPLLLRAMPLYPSLPEDPWYSQLTGWRTIVVGPVSEELVFRACMIPLLVGAGFSAAAIVFIIPLFFALAHVHHVRLHLHKTGEERRQGLALVAGQLVITSIFGVLSAFLFVRTGHVLAPTAAHVLCNYLGPPDIPSMLEHRRRTLLLTTLCGGFIAFWIVLYPLTNPTVYGTLYWSIIGTSRV